MIGVPGDVISMHDKQVMINGKQIKYEFPEDGRDQVNDNTLVLRELIENKPHEIQINAQSTSSPGDFSSLTIPENSYFVLGDNRDNSRDSRYIGLVPRHEIVGRGKNRLYFSLLFSWFSD